MIKRLMGYPGLLVTKCIQPAKRFVLWLILLVQVSASAGQVTFNDLNFSESLFPCNVGIGFTRGGAAVCSNPQTGLTCSPEIDRNCVCVSPGMGSNYIRAIIKDPQGMEPSRIERIVRSPSSGIATLIPLNDPGAFTNEITFLDVQLSSETYGAEYFVDFCYLGPVPKYREQVRPEDPLIDETWGVYAAEMSARAVSLLSGQPRDGQKLIVQMSQVCDTRALGRLKAAREVDELRPPSRIEADSSQTSTPFSLSANIATWTSVINPTFSRAVPRFCSLRVAFRETATGPRRNLSDGAEIRLDVGVVKAENSAMDSSTKDVQGIETPELDPESTEDFEPK
jgi:hypothetical protein